MTSIRANPFLQRIGLILLILSTTACTAVGPDYETPILETGDAWSGAAANFSTAETAELASWWKTFGDPTLERLVDRALEGNLDLRQALARVAEARAARDAALGRRMPTIDALGSVEERRQSENGTLPIDRIPDLERDQTIWQAGFDASWEADLFGRVRRSIEAAEARALALEEDALAVRLRVLAEVARNYFDLRGAQHRLTARQAATEASRRTLDLVRKRFVAGDVALAEVSRAEAELRTLQARLPELESAARAAALALGILIGQPPETELALATATEEPVALRPVPVGERAAILARRPDVRAAERRLAASTAEIGLAMAERYPRLAIGAGGGFQALDAGDLLEAASQTWSILPMISWRIFDGGRIRAEIRASEARAEAAALAFEAAVLRALTEAEQALVRYHFGLETLERQELAVAASQRSFEFARQRYAAGDVSLLEMLDAERVLRDAEEATAAAHTLAAVELVGLYKALGGGWGGSSVPTSAGTSTSP